MKAKTPQKKQDWRDVYDAVMAMEMPHREEIAILGTEIGKLHTNNSLPLEFALSKFDYDKNQKIVMLDAAAQWFLQCKHESGATDNVIARQLKANEKMMRTFILRGKPGVGDAAA